jgi:hypothetical protein
VPLRALLMNPIPLPQTIPLTTCVPLMTLRYQMYDLETCDIMSDIAHQGEESMAEEQESSAELLVRALNELEPEQRDQVLAWLFDRIPQSTIPTAAAVEPWMRQGAARRWAHFASAEASLLASLGDFGRKDMKMVPVRMPVDQHAQLQEWCKEHNFSMATVIRGLLARFLDEQGQTPGTAAG